MKGVQCYELFGGIALKIHTFSFSFFIMNAPNPITFLVHLVIIMFYFFPTNCERIEHRPGFHSESFLSLIFQKSYATCLAHALPSRPSA